MRDWLALPRMLAATLLVAMTVATRPAHAQMINTGGLFISTDEVVMVDDDFIQADATQSTINQGTLMISGTLRFIDGVIDETGGALVNRLTGQGGVRLSQPDFHTLFLASAQSQGASAVLDDGGTNAVIDGPVRRIGGGEFVFPTGDNRSGEVYRGLVGLSAPDTAGEVDVHYHWRDGLSDFGVQRESLLIAVTDREYWQVWGDSAIDISPMYESTSRIDALIQENPGATLDNLTLAGWTGAQWVDLGGQAGTRSDGTSGFVTARLALPSTVAALTFALRLAGEEDSDNDSVPNDKEWDSNGDGQGPDDTDNDGTPDYLDPDDDGDGFLTRDEDWDQSGTPCDDDRDGDGRPDYLDPDAGDRIQLWVTKSASQARFSIGDIVNWTLSVENRSRTAVTVTLLDILPLGLAVDRRRLSLSSAGRFGPPPTAAQSAPLHHPDMDPDGVGLVLHWPDLMLQPGETRYIEFLTEATIGLDAGEYINRAFAVTETAAQPVFSNLAAFPFELRQDVDLGCTTVIGRVFNDVNVDGVHDPEEPGIAAARIGEHSGLIIRTDEYGRFHLPCAVVPHGSGKNLVLKLDERTLPAGYKMTSENPRVVRVTRGKVAKANFGAALSREVTLNISDCTFAPGAQLSRFHPAWTETLARLMQVLDQGPARLVIDYTGVVKLDGALLQDRFDRAETDVRNLWKSRPRRYDLDVSFRSRRLIGTEKLPCQRFAFDDHRFDLPTSSQKPQPSGSRWSPRVIKPPRGNRFFAATGGKSR